VVAVIRRAAITAALAVLTVGAGTAGAQVAGCAAPAPGGDWPLYGGTLDNHREQTAEKTISPANASALGLAWKVAMPDGGVIQSTPTVADGCVFTGTDLGDVYAINADTGHVVWSRSLQGGGGNFAVGAGIIGAPAVANGLVYVAATAQGKSLEAALDQATGQIVWSKLIDSDSGGGADATPVPFDGMVFQSYQGDESSNHSNPGFVIMDGSREGAGQILVHTKILSAADYAAGDRGGSITATSVVDLEHKLLYAANGNPANGRQNPITDSFLKIDVDPASATFGKILSSRRFDSESYPAPQDVDSPTCHHELQWPASALSCAHFDMDFVASGSLFSDSAGHQLFGDLQKSGVYHVVNTATMQEAWKATLGVPCLGCNLSSSAVDASAVYVAVTGGNLYALDKGTGAVKWVAPATGATHFEGVTVANGVVYTNNDLGGLEAFNAADGTPLLAHPFFPDTNTPMTDAGNSSGISVARGTVFVSSKDQSSSTLFAYKLGAAGGGGGGLPPVPAPPGVGGGTGQVVSGPGAATAGYLTPVVVMQKGGTLTYTNLADIAHHDVDSVDNGPDGAPLFASDFADLGESVPVVGVDKLAAGQYRFKCSLHVGMQGTLVVQ
jgi:polyvinyl alcohol dehydrogenase (cytochrome)